MVDTALYTSLPVATSASSWGSNASMVRIIGSARARYRSARSMAMLRRSAVVARFSTRSGNWLASCSEAGGMRIAPLATDWAVSAAACAAALTSFGLGTLWLFI